VFSPWSDNSTEGFSGFWSPVDSTGVRTPDLIAEFNPALAVRCGQANRSKEERGEGEVYEKSLEMTHSRVFPYPEEADLAPSWAAGVARDRKNERNRSNEGGWVYTRSDQGAKRESRSTSTLRRFILRTKNLILISLLTLLAALPLHAQQRNLLRVQIPYAFSAGGKDFTAGQYELRVTQQNEQVIRVTSSDGKNGALVNVLTRTAGAIHTTPTDAHVVFDVLDGRHILAEVWFPEQDAYILNVLKEKHTHEIINVPMK